MLVQIGVVLGEGSVGGVVAGETVVIDSAEESEAIGCPVMEGGDVGGAYNNIRSILYMLL